MKSLTILTTILLATAVSSAGAVTVSPAINSINVEGYMKKVNGQAVTDDSGAGYDIAFGVYQNGTCIWATHMATNVRSGLFSASLSGLGTNMTGLIAGSCNANFAAKTLNPALLTTAPTASGAVTIQVYAIDTIDTFHPNFTISVASVPTAYVAGIANAVQDGAITFNSLDSSTVYSNTSAANKLLQLDASGLVNSNMLPPISAATGLSGTTPLANGGTGSTDGSITGSGAITFKSAAGSSTTIGDNSGAASAVIRSGTGGISGTVATATGNVAFTAGSTSGGIALTPGTTSGTVAIGSATSTGTSTFGNQGGASSTTIFSGTGHILLSPAGAGVVRLTNGNGLNIVNGSGSITINAPLNPTSYVLSLPSTSGSAGQFLQTDGAGVTTWSSSLSPTGPITLNPSGALTLGGSNLVANPSGAITLNPTGAITLSGSGVDINSLGNIALDNTGNISLTPTGNVSVSPTGAVTMSPTGALTVTGSNILFNPSGAIVGTVSGTTGNVNFTAGSTSGAVNLVPGTTSGGVTIGSATSSGNSNFGNQGGASITNIFSGTGSVILSPTGAGLVRIANGNGLNLVNGSGSITVASPLNPTSYVLTLPSTAGSAGQFLQTDGSGTSTWSSSLSPTGPITLNPSGALTLGGTNVNLNSSGAVTLNPTGALTLTGSGVTMNSAGNISLAPTGNVSVAPSGSVTMNPTGAMTLGGASINMNSSGNVTISPSGAVTMNPTGAVTVGGANTVFNSVGNVTLSPSGAVTLNPTGAVTISPSGTLTLNPTGALTIGGSATIIDIGSASLSNTNAGFGATFGTSNTTIRAGSGGITLAAATIASGTSATSIDFGVASLSNLNAGFGTTFGTSNTTIRAGSGGLTLSTPSIVAGSSITNIDLGSTALSNLNAGMGSTFGTSGTTIRAGLGGISFSSTGPITLPSASAIIPARIMSYANNPGAATMSTSGFAAAPATTGTAANGMTNTAPFVTFVTTAAAANNCAGTIGSIVGRIGHNITWETRILTEAVALTNQRMAIGLAASGGTLPAAGNTCNVAANGPAHADVITSDAAYFRSSTAVPDTKWQCITCGAGTCTTNNSNVTIANSAEVVMKIITSSTKVQFYINDALVCTNTTNLPAAATNLVSYIGQAMLSATTKTLGWSYITAVAQ